MTYLEMITAVMYKYGIDSEQYKKMASAIRKYNYKTCEKIFHYLMKRA